MAQNTPKQEPDAGTDDPRIAQHAGIPNVARYLRTVLTSHRPRTGDGDGTVETSQRQVHADPSQIDIPRIDTRTYKWLRHYGRGSDTER